MIQVENVQSQLQLTNIHKHNLHPDCAIYLWKAIDSFPQPNFIPWHSFCKRL